MNWLQKATTWLIGGGLEPGRQDGDNFIANRITLQEHTDTGGSDRFMALSAVWACTRLVASSISSLPLVVSDDRHPLYRVLKYSPNALQTSLNFWQFMAASVELHGSAFAEIVRLNGRIIALNVPFAPEVVRPRMRADGDIEYEVGLGAAKRVLARENMLHIRGFGGHPLGGMSTLRYGSQAFGTALAIDKAAGNTFRNGVNSSGVFMSKRLLDKEQMGLARQIVEEKYAGSLNQGRPMVLNNDMDFQQLSINPDDAQMLESRGFSVEEVCRFFMVPPHMIGHTAKTTSWGRGIEQMTMGFLQYTLRERLKNIETTLEKQLLTEAERQAGIRITFNIEGLLRADVKTRSEVHASAIQTGWMTRNEVREIEGLPPKEGGDELLTQMQNIPITQAGTPKPPPTEADNAA